MGIPSEYISVDWGTSNFRAKVVDTASLATIDSCSSPNGVKKTFETFKAQAKFSQQDYFIGILLSELSGLTSKSNDIPIVASGMASSSIGIKNLVYADFPIDAAGHNLKYESIKIDDRELFIISGAKDAVGFMRGEEVQAIGLSKYLDQESRCVLVLPGTHSKHLVYENGHFVSMKNFMTGELYQVLSQHSILSYSVQESTLDTETQAAFMRGLDIGSIESLSGSLLSVRYGDLMNQADPKESSFLLSGILIGNELSYLQGTTKKIYLGASGTIHKLYNLALNHVCNEDYVFCLDQKLYDQASVAGQQKILKLHYG